MLIVNTDFSSFMLFFDIPIVFLSSEVAYCFAHIFGFDKLFQISRTFEPDSKIELGSMCNTKIFCKAENFINIEFYNKLKLKIVKVLSFITYYNQ